MFGCKNGHSFLLKLAWCKSVTEVTFLHKMSSVRVCTLELFTCKNVSIFSGGHICKSWKSSLWSVEEESHTFSLTLYSSPPLSSTVGKTNLLVSHITIQVLHFVPFIPIQHHWIQAALEDYSGGLNLHAYLHLFKKKPVGREYLQNGRCILIRQEYLLFYILQIKAFFQYVFVQTSFT